MMLCSFLLFKKMNNLSSNIDNPYIFLLVYKCVYSKNNGEWFGNLDHLYTAEY